MKLNITKVYSVLGKSLCGCAGGIIGFLSGGVVLAFFGIAVGILVGHFLEKLVVHPICKG